MECRPQLPNMPRTITDGSLPVAPWPISDSSELLRPAKYADQCPLPGMQRKWRGPAVTSQFVKVCGCRPHEGGAAHTGAGVRKPPMEETAGGVSRLRVRRYGDFGAGGLLPRCVDRLIGKRSMGGRVWSADRDGQNRGGAAEIDRRGGCPGRRAGEHSRGRSRAGEADVQHWNVAANLIMMCRS